MARLGRWNIALAIGTMVLATTLSRQRHSIDDLERSRSLLIHEHEDLRKRVHEGTINAAKIEAARERGVFGAYSPEQRDALMQRFEVAAAGLTPEQRSTLGALLR